MSFDELAGSRFPYDMLMLIQKRNSKKLDHKQSIPLICIKDIIQGSINFHNAQFAFAIGNISGYELGRGSRIITNNWY